MLRIFGLGEGEKVELGWGQTEQTYENANVSPRVFGPIPTPFLIHSYLGFKHIKREDILIPYLRALSSFRDGVRQLAIGKGDTALKDILALCDKLRDADLVPLGVALDDQDGKYFQLFLNLVAHQMLLQPLDGKALVKLVPPAELIKVRDEKRAQQQAKAAEKARRVEMERQKELAKRERGRVPPHELFKPPNVPEGTYGACDDAGLPLTDGEGKELSKSQIKKLQKAYQNQEKWHQEFLEWNETQ